MAEYIDLELAKRYFQNVDAGRVGGSTLLTPEEFAEYLDEIEPADVAPVRHARWNRPYISWFFPLKIKDSHCYCTHCGNPAKHRKTTNYCSYCGAVMDGGIEDATD